MDKDSHLNRDASLEKKLIDALYLEVLKNPQISFFVFSKGNIPNDPSKAGGDGMGEWGWVYDHASRQLVEASDELDFLQQPDDKGRDEKDLFQIDFLYHDRGESRYLFVKSITRLQGGMNNPFVHDKRDGRFCFGIRFPKELEKLQIDPLLREHWSSIPRTCVMEVFDRLARHYIPDYFAFMLGQLGQHTSRSRS